MLAVDSFQQLSPKDHEKLLLTQGYLMRAKSWEKKHITKLVPTNAAGGDLLLSIKIFQNYP